MKTNLSSHCDEIQVSLGDICDYVNDKIPVADLTKSTYVSTENMLSNKKGIVDAENLPNMKYAVKFCCGDILVSNIRPYFKKIFHANFDGGCSHDVLVFRPRKGCLSKFLYYVLSSDYFFDFSTASSKGTKMPRGDKNAIMQFPVFIKSIDIQQKISSILSSFDNKIEINNKINEKFMHYATSLFNYQYDNLCKTQKNSNLTDIAEYLNGLAVKKYRPKDNEESIPVLKIRELRQGFCDSESDPCSARISNEYIINDGDLIFSWSGSLLVDFWCGGKCALNQHLFKVTPKRYGKWFSYMWTCHHLDTFIAIAEGKATTMGHIKREDLARAEVILPTDEEYAKMDAVLAPIFDAIIQNRVENRKLSSIRDSLLPRLMSGELDVSELDI